MENGTALEYVKAHPETDIVALVSMPTKLDEANLTHIFQSLGIAHGLGYLHEQDIVHSDMKSVAPVSRLHIGY